MEVTERQIDRDTDYIGSKVTTSIDTDYRLRLNWQTERQIEL